jgi:hypothetical protein
MNHDVEMLGKDRTPQTRSLGEPIPNSPTYVGGVRYTRVPFDFGWPCARLVVLDQGVWIGPSALVFRLFVPVRRFSFEESDIQPIGRSSWFAGIRFHSRESGYWMVFWTWRRNEILREIQSLTSGVTSEPIPVNFFRPGP